MNHKRNEHDPVKDYCWTASIISKQSDKSEQKMKASCNIIIFFILSIIRLQSNFYPMDEL